MLRISILLMTLCLTLSAVAAHEAKDGTPKIPPHDADLIFKIKENSITWGDNAHMLVCIEKGKKVLMKCTEPRDIVTLQEFWKLQFPQATNIRVVAMDYRANDSVYLFWLKR